MTNRLPFDSMTAYDAAIDRVRSLNELVWENRVREPEIERWLSNFTGEVFDSAMERDYALMLLTQFSFYGEKELRVLLKAMFRDLIQYPGIQRARTASEGKFDMQTIEDRYRTSLGRTRFLGMGNPSESGSHLLYYFRQENRLPKSAFIHSHEVLTAPAGSSESRIAIPDLERLVFIDDVLGSGQQVIEYSRLLLQAYKEAAERSTIKLEIDYVVLFAKPAGLEAARASKFDTVEAVHVLDNSEMVFDENSRMLANLEDDVLGDIKSMVSHYGSKVFPGHPLGYRNGQLLLGFHHNIPDNTLPIFWTDEAHIDWKPLFPRFPKV